MITLEVYDPAMCCSTGVCGPQVDPQLATFEADLRWLAAQGAQVTRYNLGSEPGAFAGSTLVRTILASGGEDVLPVVLVDGKLKWTGHYPSRDELAATLPSTTDGPDQPCCAPGEQDAAGGCVPAPAVQDLAAPTAGKPGTPGGCC